MDGTTDTRLPDSVWQQEIRLVRDNGETLIGTGESLFAGGFAVLLDRPLYTGEEITLETGLPNHAEHRLEPLVMRCRVVYLVELTHPANRLRAGLSPVSISQRNRRLLMQFAREQIRRRRSEQEAEQRREVVS